MCTQSTGAWYAALQCSILKHFLLDSACQVGQSSSALNANASTDSLSLQVYAGGVAACASGISFQALK